MLYNVKMSAGDCRHPCLTGSTWQPGKSSSYCVLASSLDSGAERAVLPRVRVTEHFSFYRKRFSVRG